MSTTTTDPGPSPPEPGPALDGRALRRLGPGDAAAVQRLYERCTDFHELMEGKPTRPTAGAEEIDSLPQGKPSTDKLIFGVEEPDGGLVGYLDLVRDYPAPAEWWIGLLMLDPAARGAGLGTRLFRAAAEWAAERGASAIQLGVLEHNPAAERFWRRQGFVELRRVDYTSDTGHPSRVIVMRRALEGGG